jgi:acetyltransferase-like isoleucine patch superfamily enzyme
MRREHRPAYWKRFERFVDKAYAEHFVVPQFDAVGQGCGFQNPRYIEVIGPRVTLGDYVQIAALPDASVRFTAWGTGPGLGKITVGDYSVINPGARISAGCEITLGKNALLASNVQLSDTDWHGLYDRVHDHGGSEPIVLEENVWLGEGVMVCKGVTIGKNSVIAARSVVTRDIPPNVVAAGNPAKVVKELDATRDFYSHSDVLTRENDYVDRLKALEVEMTKDNTLLGMLRYLLFPTRKD